MKCTEIGNKRLNKLWQLWGKNNKKKKKKKTKEREKERE
jgi:hypothetical protein